MDGGAALVSEGIANSKDDGKSLAGDSVADRMETAAPGKSYNLQSSHGGHILERTLTNQTCLYYVHLRQSSVK